MHPVNDNERSSAHSLIVHANKILDECKSHGNAHPNSCFLMTGGPCPLMTQAALNLKSILTK